MQDKAIDGSQLPFEFENSSPIWRRLDPKTSRIAGRKVTESGKRRCDKARVLEAVCEVPGLTSAELGRQFGVDRYVAARRLPDLRADGFVENGPARECRVTGSQAITWFPSETWRTRCRHEESARAAAGG